MTAWRPLATAVFLFASVAAGCSAGAQSTPTPEPSQASPTASPTTTPQRALASMPPEDGWHPVLELISGRGGLDRGNFEVEGRYRIRYDCVGAGTIRVKVDTEIRATRECASGEIEDPVIVREASGRLHAAVTAEGDPEWIVRIEVER